MKKAVAYCRTACGAQGDRLSRLRAQTNAIRRYANEKGLIVSETYNDVAVSGATLNRPQLQQLIADCRAGKVGMVLTQDPDRLSRDLAQVLTILHTFKTEGVQVEFVTQTGRDQFAWHHIVARALAEFCEQKGDDQ
jgi:DNA invertase Pin-like site-specific DNA recombinase